MSEVKIAFVGDIMCGDSFHDLGFGPASSIKKHGINFIPLDTQNILKNHDIVFCNIECVLSDENKNDNNLRSMSMRGGSNTADMLRKWGITVANVANNHILEHGQKAAIDTVRSLKNSGIKVVGAGEKDVFNNGFQPIFININNQEFVFVSICLKDEKYAYKNAEKKEIICEIKKLKSKNIKVIVSIHWGYEYIDRPSIDQKKFAEKLTDAGAFMVIGHHPHVIQGIEYEKENLVAYSMGNFIFGGFFQDTNWSAILSVVVKGNEIAECKTFPVICNTEHQPHIAKKYEKIKIETEIKRRSSLVRRSENCWEGLPEYQEKVEKLTEAFRKDLRRHLLKNFKKIRPVFWLQILYRPIQRRIGLW